ncbi:MAG: CRISPR-associated helicase Cas3', partial [Gammaproteobacteria bacterium]|nr:CRISPR-associated helicase Cas3' [Gammaproteobacteria bacterium]
HATEPMTTTAYPSLTMVGTEAKTQPVEPVPSTCRTVVVKRIESREAAVEYLVESARTGATCLWVRNAVDEAIAAVEWLRERDCRAKILHARFAYGDRLRHEDATMRRYGRDGTKREGQVLVATQIIEASLDLDFDVMVTDLAPIGSLIQRAGRLWRHMDRRPAHYRPAQAPILAVLSPDPDKVEDDRWLDPLLGGGAHVYRHDHLWLTARILFRVGVIEAPAGLRTLIEAVHGPDAEELPVPLERKLREAEGTALAESAQAQQNVVVPENGYLGGIQGRVWSEEKFPTRLGQEDATLVLARHGSDGLIPWCEGDTPARAWALSEVRCNRRRLPGGLPDQLSPIIAEAKSDWPRGKREHLLLCPVSGDGGICEGLYYDPEWGLRFT